MPFFGFKLKPGNQKTAALSCDRIDNVMDKAK
jgi:hypothetical protein